MSTVAGNLYELQELSGVRLGDLELPREVAEHYPGPGFGIDGTRKLAQRYRRNFPASLSPEESERWQAHCAARLHEGEGGAQTLSAFMERIDQLGETAEDERSQEILGALYDYAEQIAP